MIRVMLFGRTVGGSSADGLMTARASCYVNCEEVDRRGRIALFIRSTFGRVAFVAPLGSGHLSHCQSWRSSDQIIT